MVEEVDAIFSEKGFQAREAVIEGYYLVGKEIKKYAKDSEEKFVHTLVKQIAGEIKRSPRAMYQGVQFYNQVKEKYGSLDKWWEAQPKNVSWHNIANKMLSTRSRELAPCEHHFVMMCEHCKKLKSEL